MGSTAYDINDATKLPLAGGTLTGALICKSSTTWYNCNSSTISNYCYGQYQWNDMFQFTKRNTDNAYINEAWHIELNNEKTVFDYQTQFLSTLTVNGASTLSGLLTVNNNIVTSGTVKIGSCTLQQSSDRLDFIF